MLALIGEQFEYGDEICGAVVNVRARQEKIALWTKNAVNETVQVTRVALLGKMTRAIPKSFSWVFVFNGLCISKTIFHGFFFNADKHRKTVERVT